MAQQVIGAERNGARSQSTAPSWCQLKSVHVIPDTSGIVTP